MYGYWYMGESGDCSFCLSCRFPERFVASTSRFLFLLRLFFFFLRALAPVPGPEGEADEGRDCTGT